jgi:hypothetical protein
LYTSAMLSPETCVSRFELGLYAPGALWVEPLRT